MRELLFTDFGLTSAPNLVSSNRNYELPNREIPVIKNEGKEENFAEKIKRTSELRKTSYSFEISPAKTEEEFQHLIKSAADTVSGGHTEFSSVTWHLPLAGTERLPRDWSSVPAVRVALGLLGLVGRSGTVVLHLSAAGLRECDVAAVLEAACGEGGADALFLVRGDAEASGGDFSHAVDLVKFVRSQPVGKRIAIGVAGYPLGHPESRSREEELLHLREKVEAGADFIISQVVFDATTFLRYVENCRHFGITVPILAGIPIVTDARTLERLCRLCQVPLPEALLSELACKGRAGGVRWCVQTCRQLLAAGSAVAGLHFFTLNSIDNLKQVLSQLPVEEHSADADTSGSNPLQLSVSTSKEFLATAPQ